MPDRYKPGRTRKVYRHIDVKTPLEKLAAVPQLASFLREGINLRALQDQASAKTDLQAATELNRAREKLFATIRRAA
ncbi:hypothetical protein SBBP2_230001 [Burkholderiales bacterium]|nr:hypothetical protein SBBP2_230001 [Burkholderiales bacterium]